MSWLLGFFRSSALWLVVVAVLAVALMVQRNLTAAERMAHAETKATFAAAEANARQQALEHERAAALREQDLIDQMEANAWETSRVQQALRDDRDRADAAARSLRQQLARLTERHRAVGQAGADTAAAPVEPPAGDAIGVLADVLGRCDERAGVLAAFADEAHAAGRACERDYDAARAALMPGLGLKWGLQ